MIRLLMLMLLVVLLPACSTEPRERMLPADATQWETDKKFQAAVAELTFEEQNVLATYLVRMEAAQLAGEALPPRMTIGEAIQAQLSFDDQWQELRQERVNNERAEKIYLHNYLPQVEVVGFDVRDQPIAEGAGMQKVFCGTIVNNGDRPLCDVQLTVYFLDKFGNEVSSVNYKPVTAQADPEVEARHSLQPHERIAFNYPVSEDAPPNWPGMASAMVTSIAFQEEGAEVAN